MTTDYEQFLKSKRQIAPSVGFDVTDTEVNAKLFGFQRQIVRWSLKKGRSAVFATTGLGKTYIQLEWGRLAADRTLGLAPLAVAQQTAFMAKDLGIPVTYARSQDESPAHGITMTNYEMLGHFDPKQYGAVFLDESSILKSYSGTMKKALVAAFRPVPMRLCCTATPAPNDTVELCNHADFLEVMSPADMLAVFFISKGQDQKQNRFRLKRHARGHFFRWLASWSMSLNAPSDLGFSDEGYTLPPLEIKPVIIDTDWAPKDQLFFTGLKGIVQRSEVRRATVEQRVTAAVELVRDSWKESKWVAVPNMIDNGIPRIETSSLRESENGDVVVAPKMQNACANTTENGIGKSGKPSAKSSVSINSVDMDSLRKDTNHSLKPNRGAVPSAPASPETADSTSTTIILPDEYGDSSAIDATNSLVASKTTLANFGALETMPPRRTSKEPWVIWCGLNEEQDIITRALGDDCVSIYGAMSPDRKTELLQSWLDGRVPVLVTKTTIAGFGINAQHCARMAFVGLSDSYEQYFQAIRRCYRFGQQRPVHAYVVLASVESSIYDNVLRKEQEAADVSRELIRAVRGYEQEELEGLRYTDEYRAEKEMTIPDWLTSRTADIAEVEYAGV